MKKEPAVIIGAIGSVVTALIALLVAFGLDLTAEQQAAISTVVLAIVPIVVGIITRQFVFAPATVEAVEDEIEAEYQPRRAFGENTGV